MNANQLSQSSNLRGAFVAALATAHTKTLALFVALAVIWCALAEWPIARALYCLACGVLSAFAIFFATALWLVKKCPARPSPVSPGERLLLRSRRQVGNLLARVRKASDAKLRRWHNEVGAWSGPLALAHASFRGGSILTIAMLLSLLFVLVSGCLLAFQQRMLPVKGLAANPNASAAAKGAVELLESSRRLDLMLHRAGTLVLWVLLAGHVVCSSHY